MGYLEEEVHRFLTFEGKKDVRKTRKACCMITFQLVFVSHWLG